jgi:hypothetical protein
MNEPLAPNACTKCKRYHKKCDRLLPTCSSCKPNECIYDTKPARKRVRKDEVFCDDGFIRYVPYPSVKQTSNVLKTIVAVPKPLVGFDIKSNIATLLFSTPLLDRGKAKTIMHVMSDFEHTRSLLGSDDMILIYAMQAWYFKRYQAASYSERCYKTFRGLLADSYDRVLTNFKLAAAYQYLGMTSLVENNASHACFYFKNVAAYLQRSKEQQKKALVSVDDKIQTLREKYLEMVHSYYNNYVGSNYNLVRVLKMAYYLQCYVKKQYRELTEDTGEICYLTISEELQEFNPYWSQISDDFEQIKEDNFNLDITVVDRIISNFHTSISVPLSCAENLLLVSKKT